MVDILRDRFFELLDAVVSSDEARVRVMTEKRFADKIVANLPALKKADLKFERGSGLCKI
jgi:hypothetical protein